jgi:DNA-binding response OmpR family regulator
LQIDEYDALIVDLNLPDGNALQLINELRQHSNMPAVIISGAGSPESRATTLDLGADDYLMKPFSTRELQARVYRALGRSRGHQDSQTALEFEGFTYDRSSKKLCYSDGASTLTDLEARLLTELVSHAGRACSRKQLYENVNHRPFRTEDKTIDIYVARLRKIFAHFMVGDVIETVRGVGYRFTPKPKKS